MSRQHPPTWLHAYNAATILLGAMHDVAVAYGGTLFIDRANLREVLTATTDFSGIIGAISGDEFGDWGAGHVHISHHTNSSVTDVANLPVVYLFIPRAGNLDPPRPSRA